MANKSIVSNSKLDSLADAISAKTQAVLPMTIDRMIEEVNTFTPAIGPSADDVISGNMPAYNGSVATVRPYAFYNDNTLSDFESDVCTSLGEGAFFGSGVAFVTLSGCEQIGNYAFQDSGVRSPSFPACRSIGEAAFSGTSIEYISFGGLASQTPVISSQAFADCKNLSDVYINYTGGVVTLNSIDAFDNTPIANGKGHIHVPANLLDAYKADSVWGNFASYIVSN